MELKDTGYNSIRYFPAVLSPVPAILLLASLFISEETIQKKESQINSVHIREHVAIQSRQCPKE